MIYKGNDNYYLEANLVQRLASGRGDDRRRQLRRRVRHRALPANTWSYLTETYDGTDAAAVRQRHAGRVDRPHRRDRDLHQPAADRRRQPLRPVLRRPDRRGPRLQHRPHRHPNPNRPDHLGQPPGPDTTPPSQPGTLTATAVSGGEIDLSWGASSDNVGVTGYQLERCQGAGCSNFTQIATPTATSYKDTTVSATTSYSYRVRATDAAGNLSPYSNTATTTTPTPDTTPPSQPGTLTATAVSGSEIDLSWGASSDNVGVTGYQRRALPGRRLQQLHPNRDPGPPPATKTPPSAANTSYSYRVRATDAAGNLSPYSNTAATTTPSSLSDPVQQHRRERRRVVRLHLLRRRIRHARPQGSGSDQSGARRSPQLPLRPPGRAGAGNRLRRRTGDLAQPRRTRPVQPHDHRALVCDRPLVRGQPQRPEPPLRDVHDKGSRALGDAEPRTPGRLATASRRCRGTSRTG